MNEREIESEKLDKVELNWRRGDGETKELVVRVLFI